jgi:ATP-dependent DNA ligase
MERRAEGAANRKGRAINAHFIAPMTCLAVAKLPTGSAWEYELKLDCYRAIALKTGDRVHLKSRNGKDFAQRYPALIRALESLPDETVIDGEIVALDDSGRPSFKSAAELRERGIFAGVLPLRSVDPQRRVSAERTAGGSPSTLKHASDATAGRTDPLL